MYNIAIRCCIAAAFAYFIRKVSGKQFWLFGSFFWFAVIYKLTIIPGTIFRENCADILVLGLCVFVFVNFIRIKKITEMGIKRIPFELTNNKETILLLGSFFMMYLVEFIRIIVVDDGKALPVMHLKMIIYMFLIILSTMHYLYLRKLDSYRKIYHVLLKPYYFLCVGICFAVLINIILALTGIIDMYNWHIPEWVEQKLVDRDILFANAGGEYRFPLYSSLVMVRKAIESPFNYQGILGTGGRFTGLSYEPHVAMLFVTPALFLSGIFHKNKKIAVFIKALFVIFIAAASSIVNFISLFIIIFLILLKEKYHYFIVKVRKRWIVVLFILFLPLILYLGQDTLIYVFNRVGEIPRIHSSGGTAFKRLVWLFTPQTIFGIGTFPRIESRDFYWLEQDVGLLPSLVMTLHMVIVLYLSLKLFFSKYGYAYFGLCTFYLVLHNLKVFGDLAWNQFYLFMLFMLCLHLNYNNSSTISKISSTRVGHQIKTL
jgi:hypothetical protein